MAAMVDGVDGVTLAEEPRHDVVITSAVLAQTVDEHDHGSRRRVVRGPGAPEDAAVKDAGERPGGLGHACSSAHGTTTASSWGESRATTYSAGSESETFSTTWVMRGGT